MSLLKTASNAKVKILGKTKFNTSLEEGGGGGGFVSPLDTTIYDSEGNILFTVNGNVPEEWKSGQNIEGYVDIGTSATSIGSYAFYYNDLTSVTIPNSVTSIGMYAFRFNQLASSLTIPNSVTDIGIGAFEQNSIISVTIGNSVTDIRAGAFANNQLTSVTIPNSVTNIENGVFANNFNLATVNCYTTQGAFTASSIFFLYLNAASPLTINVRATDSSWDNLVGTGQSFQARTNVTVIKNL